ncbi:MAG TPA: MFS transporter, partial [Candidatus Limnocylindrales bacterium]|nr:MFS transporter [Candidatus Limnocylindrales bacterium]
GGIIVPWVRRRFSRRTHALILGGVLNVVLLLLIGVIPNFWVAIALLAAWAMVFAIEAPIRQAFVNGLIPSEQRATVLSFDSLMGSAGGVVAQPALGRTADLFGYGTSYVASAAAQALAIPFVLLARRENAPSDPIGAGEESPELAA